MLEPCVFRGEGANVPLHRGIGGPSRCRLASLVTSREAVALRLGRNWRVSPFGSAANGFGTKFSDLDATCYELPEKEEEKEEQKQPAEILSERLAPLLREHPDFTMAQEAGAKSSSAHRAFETHFLPCGSGLTCQSSNSQALL